jgi:hypothetical protein
MASASGVIKTPKAIRVPEATTMIRKQAGNMTQP